MGLPCPALRADKRFCGVVEPPQQILLSTIEPDYVGRMGDNCTHFKPQRTYKLRGIDDANMRHLIDKCPRGVDLYNWDGGDTIPTRRQCRLAGSPVPPHPIDKWSTLDHGGYNAISKSPPLPCSLPKTKTIAQCTMGWTSWGLSVSEIADAWSGLSNK